ncbi:hypothetical protein BDQ17DRAFT_1325089 [Cyathus striatus]|nr:hypothetical protein BDQ17DRAFT_1325089 [Cyathus striatus]
MSSSPREPQEEGAEKTAVDELDEPQSSGDAEAGPSTAAPQKRGRGRPKGSKNKKSADGATSNDAPTQPARKRGRPPKEKKDDSGEEPAPKRPRGRPRKNPKPEAATGEGGDGAETPKRKRGRPKKTTT